MLVSDLADPIVEGRLPENQLLASSTVESDARKKKEGGMVPWMGASGAVWDPGRQQITKQRIAQK